MSLGNKILWSGYDDSGERFLRKETFEPKLFTVNRNQKTEPVYHSLFGEPLQEHRFDTMADARKFLETREGTNINVYGNTNYVIQFIAEKFPNGISNTITADDVNICYFDLTLFNQ